MDIREFQEETRKHFLCSSTACHCHSSVHLFRFRMGHWIIATQDIYDNKFVRDMFAALFVIITAFHGCSYLFMPILIGADRQNLLTHHLF